MYEYVHFHSSSILSFIHLFTSFSLLFPNISLLLLHILHKIYTLYMKKINFCFFLMNTLYYYFYFTTVLLFIMDVQYSTVPNTTFSNIYKCNTLVLNPQKSRSVYAV